MVLLLLSRVTQKHFRQSQKCIALCEALKRNMWAEKLYRPIFRRAVIRLFRLFRKKTSKLRFARIHLMGGQKRTSVRSAIHYIIRTNVCQGLFDIFSALFMFCVFYEKCIVIVLRGKRNAFSRAGFVRICTPTIVFNIRQKLYLKDLAR